MSTNIDLQKYSDSVLEKSIDYFPTLLTGLLTLVVGLFVIKLLMRGLDNVFARRKFDPSLSRFLHSMIGISLKVLLVIVVAGMIGIQTTSLIALVGAAGLAIGLALQGSLSNFAGGVLILVFKPFTVGEYVVAQGVEGYVQEIQIFNTILKTATHSLIVIPNGELSNGLIENYSALGLRRLDIDMSISYGDDIEKARTILKKILDAHKDILNDPAPQVLVGVLNESSVDLRCRLWIKTDDSFGVKFDLYEATKKAFDAAGISIPFPQQDIHHHYHGNWPEKNPTEVEM